MNWHCSLLMLMGCLLFGTGCANRVDREEIETWGPRQWEEAKQQNAQRLLPEEERRGVFFLRELDQVITTAREVVAFLYDRATGNTADKAAEKLFDQDEPDSRREGVFYFARRDYGRQPPYVTWYFEMARTDTDHTVRAAALRALNRARVKVATPLFIQAMTDRHPLVRLEAVKALGNIPDRASVATLLKRLGDANENMDVRVAAADALRNHATAEVAQALIRVLRERDFAVSWQARKSLKLMTGEDYRYDQVAWLTYLTGTERIGLN